MTHRLILLTVLAVTTSLGAAQAADPPALCATSEQSKAVAGLYAQSPAPAPFMAAPRLGVPEAVVLSALPVEKSIGTGGEAFTNVWESLRQWPRALTLVLKGGQVFEIHGRIPRGEPSKVSQMYNLEYPEAGLGGHLRPDLIKAIYAISLEGREGPMRGVAFLDASGEAPFHVFLPESQKPTPNEIAAFERTRELIAGLPRACPAVP